MSSSEATQLRVSGGRSTLEIQVVDSNFAPVASATGSIDVSLTPGLYELNFREGADEKSQIIKATGGALEIDAPHFQATSPAPIKPTTTSHEFHEQAVVEASKQIAQEARRRRSKLGGLLVMVRNVDGSEQLPFPKDISRRLAIVGPDGAPIGPAESWAERPQEQWALWARAVPAGGYALETANQDERTSSIRQALWVDAKWQTLLFIPNTREGPAPDLATVHITQLGQWSPGDEASAVAIALENVLNGLRTGRSVVPVDLDKLFRAKFVNPFLGIAAAHALLLDPNRSLKLLATVIGNLERLLPGNPDVVALGHRAQAAGAKVKTTGGVSWPPLLYAGYRALIRADASDTSVIVDRSPADAVAASLRLDGIWTTWANDQTPPQAATSSQAAPGRARDTADALSDATSEPATESASITPDPATERVLSYINGAAELQRVSPEAIIDQRSVSQLALATGLPSGAVSGALEELQSGDATSA